MLKPKNRVTSETFSDGIINVLEARDGIITKTLHTGIRFGNRTIGVSRFFNAEVAGNKIEKLISVPLNDLIKRNDLIELKDFRNGKINIFKIVFMQAKFDTAPPCIYLTLERTDILYDDNRKDNSTVE